MKKIIIIGAGIGGLTAANLLVKKGHQVTLFESHSTAGGYIAGFRRKGYYFESGTLALESSSEVFNVMKQIGIYDKVGFIKKEPIRYVADEFDYRIEDWNAIKHLLYSSYPDEKQNIDAFFRELDPIIRELKKVASIPSMTYAEGLGQLSIGLSFLFRGRKFMKFYKKYGRVPVIDFIGRFFRKNTSIYNFLSTFVYPDMSTIALSGMMEMYQDYWTVKDGMQSWADALADNFQFLGGDLRLNTYVDGIITKDGAAVGVKAGDTCSDADYVFSSGDYKKTFLELLDDRSLLPAGMAEKIKDSPVSKPFFTVYLGLNMPGGDLKMAMKTAEAMLFQTLERGDVEDPENRDYFTRCPLVIYSPSMINENHAPPGKSSLMIQTIAPLGWMDNWGGGDRTAYLALKEKVMNTFIKRAGMIIPGLQDRIDYMDAATPLTYERFTHNTAGAHSSWSIDPRKNFYSDGTMVQIKTPVKRLYLSSAWATPYGGVPEAMGAGYLCAKVVK